MKRKIFVSKNERVDIYQFMRMCGLECAYKSNIKISHKIMQRKLERRWEVYPNAIIIPQRVDYSKVDKEELANGNYLAVIDDCGKVIIYKNPRRKTENDLLAELQKTNDKKKLERIRHALLEELGYEQSASGEITKKEQIEFEPEVTEKINRNNNVIETGRGRVRRLFKY